MTIDLKGSYYIENGTYIFNPNPTKGTETYEAYIDLTNQVNLGMSSISKKINKPITVDDNVSKYPFRLMICISKGATMDMEWKPQLLKNDTLLPYESYKEIQSAQLTCELNGIDDVRDELIVRADGTGKLIQNIIRMNSIQPVAAGMYTKDTTKSNTDLVYFYVKNSKKAAAKTFAKIQAFSPKFAWASTNIWQLDKPYVFDAYSLEGSSNIRVLLRINKDDDIDELLETGIDILYALKEPIVTDLSAEEVQKILALHTNKPNTTIWNDQDAEMQITYVADAKNYIDNKLAEIQALTLEGGN